MENLYSVPINWVMQSTVKIVAMNALEAQEIAKAIVKLSDLPPENCHCVEDELGAGIPEFLGNYTASKHTITNLIFPK